WDEFRQPVLAASLALHHAFGGGFNVDHIRRALEITLARALIHRAQRSHSAVGFEAAALKKNGFTGALVHPGKQRADHDGTRAGGDSLRDFAGVFDAAV